MARRADERRRIRIREWLGTAVLGLTLAAGLGGVAIAADTAKAPLGPPTPEVIDAAITAKLAELKVQARPESPDGEFLRRVSLDLAGRTPRPEEIVAFLADKDPAKRDKLVDRLLDSPEFVEHWTDFWMETLSRGMDPKSRRYMDELRGWVKRQVKLDTPYDTFVSRLVRAQGYVDRNGAVAFTLGYDRDPMALASATSRIFMGAQIECAQCHDHPFADWKQEQFLKTAAWFSRIERRNKLKDPETIARELAKLDGRRRKRYMENARRLAAREGIFEKRRGELVVNERGEPLTRKNRAVSKVQKTIAPEFLLSIEAIKPSENRRESFARFLTSPQNKDFARVGVNRIWSRFFGRGLVNPIDDMSDASVTTHPTLLDELAERFVASKYSQRTLIRAIVCSDAYRRSSQPATDDSMARREPGQPDLVMTFYGRMPVRPLGAEQLSRALARSVIPGRSRRAGQLAGRLQRTLNGLLGKRTRDLDRYEETLQEALFMQNSPMLHGALGGESLVQKVLRSQPNARERLTRLFLNILTRPPSPSELKRYESYVSAQKESLEAYQDVAWTLLNTSEFRYNH